MRTIHTHSRPAATRSAGTWPKRLKSDDWASGKINWLIDVIAPDRKTTAAVIWNFKQVVNGGELRMHPIVGRLVDPEVLEKLGAAPGKSSSQGKSESIQ